MLTIPLSFTENVAQQNQFNASNEDYLRKAAIAAENGKSACPTFLEALQLMADIVIPAENASVQELLAIHGVTKIKLLRDTLQIVTTDKKMLESVSYLFLKKYGYGYKTFNEIKDNIAHFQSTLLTINSQTLEDERKMELNNLLSQLPPEEIESTFKHVRSITDFVRTHLIKEDKTITSESTLVDHLIFLENARPALSQLNYFVNMEDDPQAEELEFAYNELKKLEHAFLSPIFSPMEKFLPSTQRKKLDCLKDILGTQLIDAAIQLDRNTLMEYIHSSKFIMPTDKRTFAVIKNALTELKQFYPTAGKDIALLQQILSIQYAALSSDYTIETIQKLNELINTIDSLESTPLVIETKKMLMTKFIDASKQVLTDRITQETKRDATRIKAGNELIHKITELSNVEIDRIMKNKTIHCAEIRKQYAEGLKKPIETFGKKQRKQTLSTALLNAVIVISGIGLAIRGAQVYKTDKSFFFYAKDRELETQRIKDSLKHGIVPNTATHKKSGKARK